jgi:O-methyltransferase
MNDVQTNMKQTNYPFSKIHFVQGKVEQTIPETIPSSIALLRLDTDWYESTYHELVHLFPKLVTGGVLIIDDYGHWQGARKAVDQYFAEQKTPILLNRIDYTGRIAIKS